MAVLPVNSDFHESIIDFPDKLSCYNAGQLFFGLNGDQSFMQPL